MDGDRLLLGSNWPVLHHRGVCVIEGGRGCYYCIVLYVWEGGERKMRGKEK